MTDPSRFNIALVLTTIHAPNEALRQLANGCMEKGYRFVIAGDTKSPLDFEIKGADFFDIVAQEVTGFQLARLCPTQHYARKNIAYLEAIRSGAKLIIETDDDNLPYESFWDDRLLQQEIPVCIGKGWLNVYRYFTRAHIWPRGFVLDAVKADVQALESFPIRIIECPIQQGLVDKNPDVDAIYRLVLPLPVEINRDGALALGRGTWCPFNSQNTAWWQMVFPLLYLPSYCSFRMTDIWRSFVAQRIIWENNWYILFHGATMWQDRNVHNLMHDFEQEIPGYKCNKKITEILSDLQLDPGVENLYDSLFKCYRVLVKNDFLPTKELKLVKAWINDLEKIESLSSSHSKA